MLLHSDPSILKHVLSLSTLARYNLADESISRFRNSFDGGKLIIPHESRKLEFEPGPNNRNEDDGMVYSFVTKSNGRGDSVDLELHIFFEQDGTRSTVSAEGIPLRLLGPKNGVEIIPEMGKRGQYLFKNVTLGVEYRFSCEAGTIANLPPDRTAPTPSASTAADILVA